jgi:dephospho-CoA kinase
MLRGMRGKVFGLTGGIASGKSTVTKLFRDEGVPMIDADEVARDIVAPGQPALSMLVHTFGLEILLPDGTLDRPKLGALAFLDPGKRDMLDKITHPYLFDDIRIRLRKATETKPLVGFDAALIIETGHQEEYRPLVVVAVSPEVQVQRLQDRDQFTEAEARARIASQLPMEEKVKLADYVIWNNSTKDELIKQSLGVLARLRHP